MKTKVLLLSLVSLFLTSASCSKDEPLDPNFTPILDGTIYAPGYKEETMLTPKGRVPILIVGKNGLPDWPQVMTDEIAKGYIMKAGSGNNSLYFVYDSGNEHGRHYDCDGNPVSDNPDLKDWKVIYIWPSGSGYNTY